MARIHLIRPHRGITTYLAIKSGNYYVCTFSFDGGVELDIDDVDVTIRFIDKSCLVLKDFMTELEDGDVFIEFQDGNIVSGRDMVQSFRLDPLSFAIG